MNIDLSGVRTAHEMANWENFTELIDFSSRSHSGQKIGNLWSAGDETQTAMQCTLVYSRGRQSPAQSGRKA
jgi:hypothetical protein